MDHSTQQPPPEPRLRSHRGPAEWIGVGANIAVLIGLIFVTVQIRQNTTALRATAHQSWVSTNAQLNMALTNIELSKIVATGHADPKTLTFDNNIAYAMWMYSFMQMVQATDYLHSQGVIDESLWSTEMQRAAGHLTIPGVRQWWDAGGRTQLTTEFVRRVEATSPNQAQWVWDAAVGFRQMPRR